MPKIFEIFKEDNLNNVLIIRKLKTNSGKISAQAAHAFILHAAIPQ